MADGVDIDLYADDIEQDFAQVMYIYIYIHVFLRLCFFKQKCTKHGIKGFENILWSHCKV